MLKYVDIEIIESHELTSFSVYCVITSRIKSKPPTSVTCLQNSCLTSKLDIVIIKSLTIFSSVLNSRKDHNLVISINQFVIL